MNILSPLSTESLKSKDFSFRDPTATSSCDRSDEKEWRFPGTWVRMVRLDFGPTDFRYLSADEIAKAVRFVRREDVERYVRFHNRVREVLGGHLSIHPRNVSLQTDKLGKPRVCADRTLEISFSHAGDFGLIALSEIGSIGVDIEQESSDLDPTTIASQVFTADETRQVMEAGSTVSAREIFTGYWVQKEAILKMEGHGLLIDTRTVVAPIRARSVAIDEILTGEYVWMWRPLPGYLASLAILPAALSNLSQQLNT